MSFNRERKMRAQVKRLREQAAQKDQAIPGAAESGAAESGVVDLQASAESARELDDRLAREASMKAYAWACSVPGTPYGSMTPTLWKE